MAEESSGWRSWLRDPWLWTALGLGLVIRVLPLIFWLQLDCIRDECIYRGMAMKIVEGEPLSTSQKGWLPSPGYPYLLAWTRMLFGSMQPLKGVQVFLSLVSVVLIYGIGEHLGKRRTARIAAFLFALNPTIAWFTNTMWIETFYIFWLVASAWALLVSWRDQKVMPAAVSGVLLGCAVLFRGVATYLPPFWVLAAVYPTEGDPWSLAAWQHSARKGWKRVAAVLVATAVTVAPYSIYGSRTYGGFMVTDATVGHVLFLGNNDFPPLTFDYGNGMLTQPVFGRYLAAGRRPCNREVPPVQSSKCEVQQTLVWIRQHPDTFLSRVPMRIAQLLNPNSFLTRHLRWGYWPGIPWWFKEGLSVAIVALSAALMLLGTVGAWARARGPYAWIAVGTTVYTVATIAVMYGMTRFRLPLEALWTVYLALFLADPRGCLQALRDSPTRLTGLLLTLPPILALMLWYLPTGFPMFW